MSIDGGIFIASAAVAIFGAIMMIGQRNPVASVLYFILSLLAQAVLYVQLGALFVGAILIIVYSGAILVLFLFVIMLLNLRGTEDLGQGSVPISNFTKYVIFFGLTMEIGFIIKSTVFSSQLPIGVIGSGSDNFGSAEQVATLLFQRYLYPFELTSILLLAAIVGAVIIARKETQKEIDAEKEQLKELESKSAMTADEVAK
jgi:NADH-quinone oxidoreductase subunit J